MNRILLELVIETLNLETDEIHFALETHIKVFSYPFKTLAIEVNPNGGPIEFSLLLRNKIILQGRLNPQNPSNSYYSFDQTIALKFLVNIKQVKPTTDCSEKSEESIKINQNFLSVKGFKPAFEMPNINCFINEEYTEADTHIKYLENVAIGIEKKIEATQFKKLAENIKKYNELNYENKIIYNKESLNDSKIEEKILLLNQEKTQLAKALKEEQVNCLDKARTEEKLNFDVLTSKNEVLALKSELKNFEDMNMLIEDLRSSNEFKDNIIKSLRDQLITQEKEFSILCESLESNSSKLLEENKSIKESNLNLVSEINTLKSKFSELLSENLKLSSQLQQENLSNLLQKLLDEKKPKPSSETILILKKSIQEASKQHSEFVKRSSQEKNDLIKKSKNLASEIKNLKASIATNTLSLKSENFSMSSLAKKTEFSELLNLINKEFDCVKEKNAYLYTSVYYDSEKTTSRLLETSKQLISYQEILTKLVGTLKELNCENMGLRYKIYLAQNKLPLYIPEKGDPVDFGMAEYVNSLKYPLKIPFVKEDQGIYLFGSKNIKVKLQNRRLLVCLHDSAIPIEDFVEKNTQIELKKLEDATGLETLKNLSIITKRNSVCSNEDTIFSPLSPSVPSINLSRGSINGKTSESINRTTESSSLLIPSSASSPAKTPTSKMPSSPRMNNNKIIKKK
jgi:hypothetical protein